jgi:Carbon storage regulator (could also regulate swarming and quorum sensing)
MLVLSRNLGEVIKIGEEIEVKILAVKGGSARIGIEAPREVSIQRVDGPRHKAPSDTARMPHEPES